MVEVERVGVERELAKGASGWGRGWEGPGTAAPGRVGLVTEAQAEKVKVAWVTGVVVTGGWVKEAEGMAGVAKVVWGMEVQDWEARAMEAACQARGWEAQAMEVACQARGWEAQATVAWVREVAVKEAEGMAGVAKVVWGMEVQDCEARATEAARQARG
ncbi:hypothetical protein HYH02_003501 [Chlamydomonas schloesseri]|uniref:Uncharacterized protein n=1 Tax=Chlamydomonas schloesseri TaxID=2026947 RepID=A0A835WQF1_9CHLO|nr:hypothetical protein HYH02_003501 [Chlamydomonas schloesseri]|eukprot:KAG2451721.1 hypothetical protein HYH02_003501 [Chlamydomonas schloesseri]